PPSPAAARKAIKWLKAGKLVMIFVDERLDNTPAGPFFGRRPHLNGNSAVAVRLARNSNSTLLPYYVVRDGCRFSLRFCAPLILPPTDDPAAELLNDVIKLNSVIEPIVRDHLDQWWWLPWPIEGVSY